MGLRNKARERGVGEDVFDLENSRGSIFVPRSWSSLRSCVRKRVHPVCRKHGKLETRAARKLNCCLKTGKKKKRHWESFCVLAHVCKDECISRTRVFERHKRLTEGRKMGDDNPGSP